MEVDSFDKQVDAIRDKQPAKLRTLPVEPKTPTI